MNHCDGPDRLRLWPHATPEFPARIRRTTDQGGITVLVLSDRFLTRKLFLEMLTENLPEPYTLRVSPLRQNPETMPGMHPDILVLDATGDCPPPEDFCARLGYRAAIIVIADSPAMAQHAFDAGAIDCVISPIKPERLLRAVQRALTWIALRCDVTTDIAQSFDTTPSNDFPSFRWVRFVRNREIATADLRTVIYLRAEKKNTRVVLQSTEGYIRQGINMVAARLDRNQFWRIHRSTIVNALYVDSISQDEIGRTLVYLKSGKGMLQVSKGYDRLLLRDGIF